VSVPTGASIVSVVAGALRHCAVPAFTVAETLRAVVGT
jgi:hypothetical protein